MMKKMFLTLAMVLMTASLSLAYTNTKPGDQVELLAAPNHLTISVSPGVSAYYEDDGTGAGAGWYCISTYQTSGTFQYATAQNTTLIWKVSNTSGTLDQANLPADGDASLSEDSWTAAGWAKL